MKLRVTFLLVLAALLALPGAAAHANYFTDDGAFQITVGYKGEPVYTYQTTGLDLILRDNATGGPVAGAHETLEATLISPSGEELSLPLEPQHGQTNRYQFTDGFVLTEPGLYKLRLVGTINDTQVDGEYAMAHATEPRTTIMFPAAGLDDLEALNERIAQLEAQVAALGDGGDGPDGTMATGDAPGPAVPLLLLGALAVALLARRR